MINGKYDIEIDGQGYVLAKDSYNQQFDQPFVTQVSEDAYDASDFSVWKAVQQSDYSGGFGYQKLDADNVFYESSNVDIHYDSQEFRLSKALSSNLDTSSVMSDQINAGISFNGKMYIASGQYVVSSDSGNAGDFTSENDCLNEITDLVVFSNRLFALMDGNGYWVYEPTGDTWTQESDGSGSGTGTNEAVKFGAVFTPGNTSYLYATYANLLLRAEWDDTAGSLDWTTVKEFTEDVNNYLGKPIVYNFSLYFWSKRGSETLGSSMMYIHDGSDTIEVVPEGGTVANRMTVYQNNLFYAVFGQEHIYIKTYDGSSITESVRLDGELAGETYDSFTYTDVTASPTGSGTYYDDGLTTYSDPVHWAIADERLVMTVRVTASANYLYEFSERIGGWNRRNDFDLSSLATYALWTFAKQIYIGDDIGQVFRVEDTYADEGYLVTSSHTANVSMSDKVWKEVELVLNPIPAGTDVSVSYDVDESGSYTSVSMPTIYASDTNIVVPLSNGSSNVVGKNLRVKVELSSSTGTRTPVVKDVVMRYFPVPDTKWRWQFTVLSIDDLYLYDGVKETLDGIGLINVLRQAKIEKTIKTYKDVDYESTELAADISSTDTTITVDDASSFPSVGDLMINNERIRYTGISSNSFTGCTRGVDGTVASSHSQDDTVDNSYRVLLHDVTLVDHDNNPTIGREGLARVTLYQA